MKTKTSRGKLKAPTGVRSMQMLGTAKVNTDRPRKRGEVCRGAYISDESGALYLTNRGTWTTGIQGDDNWWHDEAAAENFLAGLMRKPPNVSDQRTGDRDATKNTSSDIAGFAASDG